MSQYLSNILEDTESISCESCNKIFKTNEITLDDFNFSWDNLVTKDCCSDCFSKCLTEEGLKYYTGQENVI